MSGKIILNAGSKLQANANTKAEFDRDTTDDHVRFVLEKIAQAKSSTTERVCYVVGMGAQPKSVYQSIQTMEGVELVFFRSVLPWYAKWLSYVVGSYEGVIKVNDWSLLPQIFTTLMDRSMVGVYIFSTTFESEFVDHALIKGPHRHYDFGVKKDSSYSYYIVDADNNESSTGIIEIVSYGTKTPSGLVPV